MQYTILQEPLSKPELFRNSSLAGSTIEMVCNMTVGRVDSYQWKKDHKPLPRSDHYQLSRNNSVLLILNATQADSGCYSCKVTNEVSENETSLELTISEQHLIFKLERADCKVVVLKEKGYFSLETFSTSEVQRVADLKVLFLHTHSSVVVSNGVILGVAVITAVIILVIVSARGSWQ
ncbi:glycine N-acyltransferase-like protein 3 [Platysternon megacephalum]|uniref:Glycine N-acyltransferase-like protein 3 n=1 Tax=Platysternon megacephalum TaxID=55544 RepID=A0A4D9DQY4_9SAUR|nr:glycine N-acyltransferase-like protein 3 [Platysternon megacephalum]